MSRTFCPRTFGRLCWQTVAIILVVFALGVSLFRGLLPKLDQVRQELVSYIEQEYQVTVQLSELSAEWQAFGPAVTIKKLVLPPQDNLPLTLIVENVHVKLDFWQTLVSASPQIENVIFEGVNIALDIDKLNQSTTATVDSSDSVAREVNIDWLYQLMLEQLERFSITDVTLQLVSQSHQYRPIHVNNLRWRNRDDSHRAQGQLYLDKNASKLERLSLSIDIDGNGYQPDSLEGQIYLAANSLDLGKWASRQVNPYDNKRALPLEGVVNLQAWADFSDRQITSATVAFSPSWLQWQLNGEQQKFEIQGGQLNWSPTALGWHLGSANLAFVTNETPWPELKFSVNKRNDHIRAGLNELDIQALLPLLPLLPSMSLAGLHKWQAMDPHGVIKNLQLDYQFEQPLLLSVDAQKVTWKYANGILGSAPIDLQLGMRGDNLYVSAPAQEYIIDFDGGFERPIELQGEAFSVKYAFNDAVLIAPKLTFENADIAVDAGLKMQFDQTAYLSLLADVDIKDAAKAKYYFPKHGMSESLRSYLEGAIKAGNSDDATVVWQGALADFPYQDNSGVFQAGFSLKQARYQFQPDWPDVTDLSLEALFENASMDLWVNKGQLLDVAADGAHVAIAKMSHETVLTVRADLHTAGDAAKEVLIRSPLKDSVGATLQVVQVQGEVDGKLDLTIPLYKGGIADIKGTVSFADTPVYLAKPGVQLDAVTGEVYFVNDVVTGEAIQANLFEQPVSLSFDTGKLNKNYGLNLDMQGSWQLDSLPKILDNPLKDYYQGQANWQGAMTLIFDPLGYRIQAQVDSDLEGVSLTLPGKFAKGADSKRQLSFELIGDNKQSSLGAKLGDQLEFWGGFNEDSAGQLAHFDLLLGRTFKPGDQLRRQQGHLQLDLPQTDLSPWLPIIRGFIADIPVSKLAIDAAMTEALATDESLAPEQSLVIDETLAQALAVQPAEAPQLGFFPPLVSIDGRMKQLTVFGLSMTDLSLQANPTEHGWRFEGQSHEFEGRVDFYPDWSSQGLKIVAKHFDCSPAVKKPEEAIIASDTVLSNLPPLAVDVDEFSLYGKQLGHLVFQGTPVGGDYQIQTISLNTPSIALKGKGAWLNNEQQNITEFELDLQAKQFDEVSERLGIDPGLKEAPLDLQAKLSWTGAPYGFSLETLNGQIDYKLGKGHLSEVSDKGARIFSLFSLDSLLRKLSLDFSDVFGKGLYFDSFSGTLKLDDGVVKTTDSEMAAVAGNMRVRGYTDLTTESLNYDIRFVPKLASSVPTVVLLSTGGWTFGLGAFALTKVLEPVIEVISEIRFRVTGTMSEPKLEELERKSKEIEIPESALPEHLRKKSIAEPLGDSVSLEAIKPSQSNSTKDINSNSRAATTPVSTQAVKSETNAAGVEIPKPVVEAPPEFKESSKPLNVAPTKVVPIPVKPKQEQSENTSSSDNGDSRGNKEQVDADKLITMSEWPRRRGQPQLYQRAA
ncbi:YhdP family protein [Shewanella psychrotolerans]|uniref:YhdP family protein n=1 Tax=Shewanella psychrotolerans TaxID=2864206 RepID=UPI001C6596EF|nr:YhdP family protein [Shewanella psychrotolerans]QYK01806.1 TIGR02099 family protein [Shewanella psychrotolerans]